MGTIVRISGRYGDRVQVTHYVNGERYTGQLRGIALGGSDAGRGMSIRIFYNPSDPRQIRTTDISATDLVLWGAFVVLSLLFSIALISKAKEKWEERKELR